MLTDAKVVFQRLTSTEMIFGLRIMVEKTYNGADPFVKWRKLCVTPLHVAADNGELNVYQYFLGKILYVNTRNDMGTTPLHLGAKNGHLNVCEYILGLIENKFPVGKFGVSPLHVAALMGHLDVCKYIMDNTEEEFPRTNKGKHPLHLAAIRGHLDLCKYMITKMKNKSQNAMWALHHCTGLLTTAN